jgi:hypothetical protein
MLSVVLAGPTRELPEAEAPAVVESTGMMVRIGGDLVVGPAEHADTVVVIDGSLRISGAAASVLVVDGVAELDGAHVGSVVVIDGHAALRGDTVVTGDVVLIGSTIVRDGSSVVVGDVTTREPWQPFGFWISGVLLPLGFAIALVLGGLALAALAPRGVRRVEAALTGEVGKTFLAALLIWVIVPLIVALSLAFVVTIPAGIGILLFVLPALAFFGYVVAGIRIGDLLLGVAKRGMAARRPYVAALVGIPLLYLIGMVPVLGGLLTVLGIVAGGGAIALVGWRMIRTRPEATT